MDSIESYVNSQCVFHSDKELHVLLRKAINYGILLNSTHTQGVVNKVLANKIDTSLLRQLREELMNPVIEREPITEEYFDKTGGQK